ncbi:MAG: hypothetical protein ACR2NZ_06105, partial [Rubripirellula sp.]
LASLEAPFFSEQDRIETLFLSTLSRLPSDTEMETCKQMITGLKTAESPGSSEQQRQATADLLWVLLNTAECATCP